MFGNYTPLEGDATAQHGFQTLAAWDTAAAGGNGDGWIDASDGVWQSLQVWVDSKHDGFSQPDELYPLSDFGITGISTVAWPEMRRDRYGNLFRFRGQFVINGQPRWAYDVFFVSRH